MKKSIILFTCLIFTIACYAQKLQYSPEVEARIKQVENNLSGWVRVGENDTWNIEERMKLLNINGISIAVISNYKIEWARGYGFADVSEKRPVTENTLFQAASVSKSINSLGVLKLVQERKIDLNTDINKYLVRWKFPYNPEFGGPITTSQLLSHTGGLTVHGFPGYEKGMDVPSLPKILDGAYPANTEAVRSIAKPGKQVIYSGGGTTITQLIIEDVTHIPYEEFMQTNVLEPLGMTASSYRQPPSREKEPLLATGYKPDGRSVPGKYHIYPEKAAAGLWTTPTDLCKYIIETQLAYRGQSDKVLSPELTRLRLTPLLEDAALGTFVNSRVTGSSKYFNHNGGNEGFSCTAYGSLNEGNGVVIMTNSDNSTIIEEILNSVAIVYKWKDFYLPQERKVIQPPEQLLLRYTGKYDLGGTVATVKLTENGPAINLMGPDWKLYFTSDSDIFFREFKGNFKFRTSEDGKVKGMFFNGQLYKKIE
jgi:CubicO group peptidase (beta-lactamase class C family)